MAVIVAAVNGPWSSERLTLFPASLQPDHYLLLQTTVQVTHAQLRYRVNVTQL
jgi:hypothetical protein